GVDHLAGDVGEERDQAQDKDALLDARYQRIGLSSLFPGNPLGGHGAIVRASGRWELQWHPEMLDRIRKAISREAEVPGDLPAIPIEPIGVVRNNVHSTDRRDWSQLT